MKVSTIFVLLFMSIVGYAQIDLPVTFEDSGLDYGLTDFGGNSSAVEVDPTDATNTVGRATKTDVAELWAGTTMGGNNGFVNPVPFTMNDTKMTVRVWSPDAGIPIRLKVEDAGDATISVETEANTTMAGAWETLEFDFSNPAAGTAALNLANTYNKASIFFNFGTTGAMAGEKTYYWDDVEFVPGPSLDPVDLPITFEDSNVDYNLVDFGGNASAIEVDPTDATNTVGRATKTDVAELWAGTTMGGSGLENPIPFAMDDTKMTVRVWSPDADIPIRLKVEDANDATISVETEATTTMAGAWETLEFDFSNPAAGTAALDLANTYDKISIFFNFGTTGAMAGEKTYYWDDVEFGSSTSTTVVDIIVNSPDHTTLETAVIAAELDDDLSGDGPFTVFAPTDDAFAAIPADVLNALLADPTGALAQVLLYHVLGAEVYSTDLSDGQMATTLQGEDITVTINGSDVFINQAMVTVADLQADNGLVHVLDAVILPPSFVGLEVLNAAEHGITISPNPASSFFNIAFTDIIVDRAQIMLYDVSGKLLIQESASGSMHQMNIDNLNVGTYFMRIDTVEASYYQKVMIIK